MVEPCGNCECGLADDSVEVENEIIPSQIQFEQFVRDYVLEHLDLDDAETFIQKVEVCPSRVEVFYMKR